MKTADRVSDVNVGLFLVLAGLAVMLLAVIAGLGIVVEKTRQQERELDQLVIEHRRYGDEYIEAMKRAAYHDRRGDAGSRKLAEEEMEFAKERMESAGKKLRNFGR